MTSPRSADPLAVTEREMLIALRGDVALMRAELGGNMEALKTLTQEQIATLRRDQGALAEDVDRLGERFRLVEARDTVSNRQLWSVAATMAGVAGTIVGITIAII
jgi:hypothetical protein